MARECQRDSRCELDVLAGGKQNRVMNTSVLVAAGATIEIPVSCAERGRWSRGRAHRSSGFSVPFTMRSKMKSEVRGESRGLQASALIHEDGMIRLGLFAVN